MSKVTKNDLKAYVKVSAILEEIMLSNPDRLLELLNSINDEKLSPEVDEILISSQVDGYDLFSKASRKEFSDIEEFLSKYDVRELSFINKYLKFPYIRSKSKTTLTREIVDQLSKRTESVFRDHE
ncbi:MAG: hypothetical protein KYX62_04250 [Pseudomonadota bacterium]|nr:hypothetical protein [Pseudomonadota bacterium]